MQPIFEAIGGTSSTSLSATRVSLTNKGPYWHYHPEIELLFMAEGQARMQVGNHVASCRAGNVLVLGPHLPHDFSSSGLPIDCDFFVVQFRRKILTAFPEMKNVSAFLDTAGGGLLLEDASEELAGLFRTIHAVKPEYRIAGLFQILANLCSDTHTDWQPLSPMAAVQQVAAGHNHLRLQKVIDTIQENFHRHVGLEEMSGLVHMAPPSFSRWFRRTMHMTFTDYLNRVRIEECCRQLRFTDHPITVIAKDCGFESLSNFNRQFHRLRDCAPRTWRSRHKEAVAQL